MGKQPFYKWKSFHLLLIVGVSALCMWLAMRPLLKDKEQWDAMVIAFQTADYRTLPVIFLVLTVFYWLKALRWRLLLAPTGDYRATRDLLPPVMIGFALNNTLPARIGEFVRCFVFSKKQKIPLFTSISSVVLERVFDAMAILFLLAIGLLSVEGIDPDLKNKAYLVGVAIVVCLFGALIYVFRTKLFVRLFERILKAIPFIPHALTEKVCRLIEAGAAGLNSIRSWKLLTAIAAISLVKWALNGSLIILSLWSFDLSISLPLVLCLLGAIAFFVAVPQAPGFFGVIQFAFTLVLGNFIPDKGALFAASIYYHLAQLVPVTIVGWLFLAVSGISLHEAKEKQEELEESESEDPPPFPVATLG